MFMPILCSRGVKLACTGERYTRWFDGLTSALDFSRHFIAEVFTCTSLILTYTFSKF